MKFEIEIDCPKKVEPKVWAICFGFIQLMKLVIEGINDKINFDLRAQR